MNTSYLVMDNELKTLVRDFSKGYPYGAKGGLKIVLKYYMKFHKKCRRKGEDPIVAFEKLVSQYVSGTPYGESGDLNSILNEKIRSLDTILEADRKVQVKGIDDGSILDAIREVKSIVQGMGSGGGGGYGNAMPRKLKDFNPSNPAELLRLDRNASVPRERQNYRDLRKKKGQKKVEF
ncbi:MAG: hypothetical protein ISR65_03140 [Bacteriovoracaceae bacterium]|nr:hypothetical protein [Bacteriovoracaceae bacterium]